MYGIQIAFRNFSLMRGYLDWVGFRHFIDFFNSFYAWRIIRNTLLLSFYSMLFGFPAPIIFALLLNEVRLSSFKRSIQTLSYLPHFISMVVICGMIIQFTMYRGLINDIIAMFGGQRVPLLAFPQYFRTIFIASDIWQGLGWGSIIYLAAIATVDQEQYESAIVDGAGRFKRMWHITLPGIMPTITILLILRIGSLMSVGTEKVLLLYSPATYSTADVIGTYIFRRGLNQQNFSLGAAVGLMNSTINMILLILANLFSKKFSETSLW